MDFEMVSKVSAFLQVFCICLTKRTILLDYEEKLKGFSPEYCTFLGVFYSRNLIATYLLIIFHGIKKNTDCHASFCSNNLKKTLLCT